jgi:hypothetical protein
MTIILPIKMLSKDERKCSVNFKLCEVTKFVHKAETTNQLINLFVLETIYLFANIHFQNFIEVMIVNL